MSKIDISGEKPDFSGYLKKKGAKIKAYRKRWFELRGERLYYFKDKNSKRPSGVIAVGSDVKIIVNLKKENSFQIKGEGLSRTFELTCSSSEEMLEWIKALKRAVSLAKNTFSTIIKEEDESNIIFAQKKYDGNLFVSDEDFEELKVIGRGSFGKVVKVKKKDTGEIFAMKILKKEMIIKENMVGHIVAEKEILAKVDHPFIVSLHYAFQTKEKLFLVLEFLSGGELFFHLKEEAKFTVDKAKFYIAEIILALEHLHKHNIIYRDLKPENCVLNYQGHVVITDFGLAKTCITNATPATTFCGTPEYLAPEILKGEGHAKAVDWWSLGILLYEMLTGLPPFYSENINEMYELILKAPLRFSKDIPKDAQSLLNGLLQRDPKKRLGAGTSDAAEIKSHKFFKGIDWEKLFKKQMKPPFTPNLTEDDTRYFEKDFTDEKLKKTLAFPVSKTQDKSFTTFGFTKEGKKPE